MEKMKSVAAISVACRGHAGLARTRHCRFAAVRKCGENAHTVAGQSFADPGTHGAGGDNCNDDSHGFLVCEMQGTSVSLDIISWSRRHIPEPCSRVHGVDQGSGRLLPLWTTYALDGGHSLFSPSRVFAV
jgi:hypothetical protein